MAFIKSNFTKNSYNCEARLWWLHRFFNFLELRSATLTLKICAARKKWGHTALQLHKLSRASCRLCKSGHRMAPFSRAGSIQCTRIYMAAVTTTQPLVCIFFTPTHEFQLREHLLFRLYLKNLSILELVTITLSLFESLYSSKFL